MSDEISYLSRKFKDIKEIGDEIVNNKIYTTSISAGILYYVLTNTSVFKIVEKFLNSILSNFTKKVKVGGNKQVLFHSVVFAILLGLTLHYIFEPLFELVKDKTIDETKNGN